MKVSLIVFSALAMSFIFRHGSAALRHWVIAAGIACAAVVPVMELVVPAWRLPSVAAAGFEPYAGGEAQAVPPSPPTPAARAAASAAVRPAAVSSRRQLDAATVLMPVWIRRDGYRSRHPARRVAAALVACRSRQTSDRRPLE
jgi:hypothetical protein